MTITLEEKQQTTIDIDLPAYYKWGTDYYKILSEKSAIVVSDWEPEFGIKISQYQKGIIAGAVIKGEKITEEEFLAAFECVSGKVRRSLEVAIESDKWDAQVKTTCPQCHGEGSVERNIPGNEGVPEHDIMVVCNSCEGKGIVEEVESDLQTA